MSVRELDQRFARPPCRELLDRLAHAGNRRHVLRTSVACCPLRKELPNSGDPGGVSPFHWRIKLSCRISPLL